MASSSTEDITVHAVLSFLPHDKKEEFVDYLNKYKKATMYNKIIYLFSHTTDKIIKLCIQSGFVNEFISDNLNRLVISSDEEIISLFNDWVRDYSEKNIMLFTALTKEFLSTESETIDSDPIDHIDVAPRPEEDNALAINAQLMKERACASNALEEAKLEIIRLKRQLEESTSIIKSVKIGIESLSFE